MSPSLFWPFALFFGWLLSFPLNGPLLYQLAVLRGFDGNQWGLLFTLCHALGFLVIGLLSFPPAFWRRAPFFGCLACLLGTVAAWIIPVQYGLYMMALMGFGASFFVMGCAFGYTEAAGANRIRFIALIILVANCILYLNNMLCGRISPVLSFIIAVLLLLASFGLPVRDRRECQSPSARLPSSVFPGNLFFLTCLLIFALDINGGFMYQVIFPFFAPFQRINRYFNLIPYMATLLMIVVTKWNRDKIFLAYLASALLGLGFMAFAFLKSSVYQYFLIDVLILIGFALLDLFIWVILGEIAENHGRTARVFGLGLFCNVLPLALGGLLAVKMRTEIDNYPFSVALFAAATIFLTSVLLPPLVQRLKSDLLRREVLQLGIEIAPHQPGPVPGEVALTPGLALTAREEELLLLILDGCTNEDIARQLQISINTVKVHVKNIIKKFGVANKNELLALVLKTYKRP